MVALAITSSVSLSNPLKMLINVTTGLTTTLANAQRMQEYASLNAEPYRTEPHQTELSWATHPHPHTLSFRDVTMRYRPEFPPALKAISFEIEAGAKAAVVGRTGAGKSSLLQALFRFAECEEGSRIAVAGADIRDLSLSSLRGSISVIPQ